VDLTRGDVEDRRRRGSYAELDWIHGHPVVGSRFGDLRRSRGQRLMLADKLRAAASVTAASNWAFAFQTYTQPTTTNGQTVISQTMNFGLAAGNRIVVLMFSLGSLTGSTISSVTIGGVNATRAGLSPLSGSVAPTEIWYAAVTSGISGSCVITYGFGGAIAATHYLQTLALYGSLSSTDYSRAATEATNTSPTMSGTLGVTAKDFVLGIWRAAAVTSGSNTTWTNLTEETDFVNAANRAASSAYLVPTSSSTLSWSVTSADGTVNFPRGLVARFRST